MEVTVNGKEYKVREFLTSEIRGMFPKRKSGQSAEDVQAELSQNADFVDEKLFKFPLEKVRLLSGMSLEESDACTMSQLEPLVEAAMEVNRSFLERLGIMEPKSN